MKTTIGCNIIICLAFLSQMAYGDFIIIVGDGTPQVFAAGSSATIPVYAFNSVPSAPFSLQGFDLGFDIGGDGVGIQGSPDYFSGFTGDFTGSIFGQNMNSYIDTAPFMPNSYDLVAGNSGSSFLMPDSSSPTKLFDLQFSISPLAASGTYELIFVPGATTGGGPLNAISGSGTSGVNLSTIGGLNLNEFVVTTVPEPASLTRALILLSLGILYRKHRRVGRR